MQALAILEAICAAFLLLIMIGVVFALWLSTHNQN